MEDILIIDDNQLTRDTLALLLDSEGLSVHGCSDGITALNLLKTNRYQIFVIDYNMPELKGDAVAARLRNLHPDCFIIGYSIEAKEKAFLAAGADIFIPKYDLVNGLIPMVKRAISAKTAKDN